jgi:hypothetical protein
LEVILLGDVLQKGGTVRVRPLDGGGNETQVEAPASGRFYVSGLENGNYEAVDELGNRRVFTVTQGTGEEVDLEVFEDLEAPAPAELGPNYGTEAPLVADESHEIQHGIPPMKADGAVLTREGSESAADVAPPTVPGPDNSAAGEPTPPHAAVTDETVGNSSDAGEEREPGEVSDLTTGDPAAHAAGTLPAPGEEPVADAQPLDVEELSTAQLAAVLRNDTAEFPEAGNVVVPAAQQELSKRADAGDAGAAEALRNSGVVEGSDVPPADDPEFEPDGGTPEGE